MVLVTGGIAQGKYAFAESVSADVVRDVHLLIREEMEQGRDPGVCVEQLVREHPDGAFTVAELGCGLVPQDAFEREYRETVGRISCALAAQADAVYRVSCGIAQRLR